MSRIIYIFGISWCISFYSISDVSSKSKYNNYVRCTRRFSPGMCVEPVTPVWTFVFQNQNCTERLGCPVDWRGNRFGSYDSCMHRCIPLVELYMEMLMHDYNASNLRIGQWNFPVEFKVDYKKIKQEEDDYEVLPTTVTVEGPAADPLDDDDDTKFRDTPDIDYFDNEDRKTDLDNDLI